MHVIISIRLVETDQLMAVPIALTITVSLAKMVNNGSSRELQSWGRFH
jgi:hypothetical protein